MASKGRWSFNVIKCDVFHMEIIETVLILHGTIEIIRQKMELRELIKDSNNKIIDVRGSFEFEYGNAEGTINIPLDEIPNKIEELKEMGGTILLCCASGNRSGYAEAYLKNHGIENVLNIGSWMDVEYLKTSVA